MKRSKNILISGYYGFDNFGDEAILGVLVKKLKELNANIKVLSVNPRKTEKLYEVSATKSFSIFRAILDIKNCDTLISGGGSLLQDVTSLKSLLYYLFIINTALMLKKKVIIFAQGIGPINNKFGAFLTKKILKRCTYVSVRDEKSLFLLRGWGISANLVCDPLFDLSLSGSEHTNRVGVQLRSFKTLKEKLIVRLAQQISNEFSDKEIEIYSFQDSLDLEVCKHFEKVLKNINPKIKTKLIFNHTSAEILEKISKLDYMVAMRFHANLIALKYGIKTLAICYDEKVEKLALEAKIPYISMLATEDYNISFEQLKNLDEGQLIEFSKSKHFDWSRIDEIVNN